MCACWLEGVRSASNEEAEHSAGSHLFGLGRDREGTTTVARSLLPRQISVPVELGEQIVLVEDIVLQCSGSTLDLARLGKSPLPCAAMLLLMWEEAAEPIPHFELQRFISHLLLIPHGAISLRFAPKGRYAEVLMTPTWTRTMSMGERLGPPHASFERAFRCSVCEDWLVPDHWHRLLRGDFGTSFYLDRFGFEDAERRGCGLHSYVCCLCYHTGTYCRLMWNDPPLDGGSKEPQRDLCIAVDVPQLHAHCAAKHPMLRVPEGLAAADDYAVRVYNYRLWQCHGQRVWERADVSRWRLVSKDVPDKESAEAAWWERS